MARQVKKKITGLAVAYCRVSTEQEEQLKSIKVQQAQLLEFLNENNISRAEIGCICKREEIIDPKTGKKRKGKFRLEKRNDGLYVDEGISGTSINNRRAFQQMIADAKSHKFDTIYVEDVTRFSRSMDDFTVTIKDLREIGITVFFYKEGAFSEPDNDTTLALRIVFAQEESQMKQRRLRRSAEFRQLQGKWLSNPPYGYDLNKSMLVINEYEAEIVKEIFRLYVYEHWGIAKICRYLDSKNIPTKRNTSWSQTVVRGIIQNKIYIGEQHTNSVSTLIFCCAFIKFNAG